MPAKPVSRLKSGRARSTRYLIPFDSANWPATTSVRNMTTARAWPRRLSMAQATRAMRITPRVPPSSLRWRRKSVDTAVACSAPKRAKRTSTDCRPNLVRIIASSTPMPTAAAADDGRRDDQGDARLGLRVEVVTEVTGETRMPHDLLGDRPARDVRVRGGRPARSPAARRDRPRRTGTEGQEDHHSPVVTPILRRVCVDSVIARGRTQPRPFSPRPHRARQTPDRGDRPRPTRSTDMPSARRIAVSFVLGLAAMIAMLTVIGVVLTSTDALRRGARLGPLDQFRRGRQSHDRCRRPRTVHHEDRRHAWRSLA